MADQERFTCGICGEPYEPSTSAMICEYCNSPLPALPSTVALSEPAAEGPHSSSPSPAHQPVPTAVEGDNVGDEDDPWGDEGIFTNLCGAGESSPHLPGESPDAPPGQGAIPSAVPSATPTTTAPWRLRLASPDLLFEVPAGAGVLLGRDASSPLTGHVSITRWISSRHARVWVDVDNPGVLWVEDLGSTNGTWVAGTQLLPGVPTVVQEGDVIMLASQNPVRIEVVR